MKKPFVPAEVFAKPTYIETPSISKENEEKIAQRSFESKFPGQFKNRSHFYKLFGNARIIGIEILKNGECVLITSKGNLNLHLTPKASGSPAKGITFKDND